MVSKKHRVAEVSFLEKYLAPLVGARIVAAGVRVDGTGAWPTLTVEQPGGIRMELEISRDPEGNGPGFIFGLPEVK